MHTTFPKYIQKPTIVGSTTSQIKIIASNYRTRMDNLIVREAGVIMNKKYRDKKGNYYLYIKIPSEVVRDFYYDVVIKFIETPKNAFSNSLREYDIQVFSNDPAFCFTYAYAFNKAGLLIDELKPKIGKDFLENKALDRNPKSEIGYVKSLYFAYFFMLSKNLFEKKNWDKILGYQSTSFDKLVMNAETKIALRQKLSKKDTEVKKREGSSKPSIPEPQKPMSMQAKPVTKVKMVKHAGTVKMVKKASRVKRKT